MKAIADTGFVVALLNSKDQHHRWANSLVPSFREALLTCESVIVEAAYLLADPRPVLELLDTGFLELGFHLEDHITEVAALAQRYFDQSPDICDLCIIRMSEVYRDRNILTTDRRDFTVYRRHQRELIPCIFPPQ